MDLNVFLAQARAAVTNTRHPKSDRSRSSSSSAKSRRSQSLSRKLPRSRLASISIHQANIHHKKKVVEIRYTNGQIVAYRPGPTTCKEIKDLQERLEGLYEYKRKPKQPAKAPRVT